MTVGRAMLETLRAAGVRYVFGNPGTTELPLLDALAPAGLEYVVALQEATVVAAADGYAQASGEVGVANVHVAPGLANGLSILDSAARSRSPLILTAGQQDTRLLAADPLLSGDLVRMAEPFTKWAFEPRTAAEAVAAMRRAVEIARTPPTGPVFLSLPMDVVGAPWDAGVPTPAAPPATAAAEPAAVDRAAALLAEAKRPAIVAGDGVARGAAVDPLVEVAEMLGAPVYGEPIYRRRVFPGDHALWRGGLYPTAAGVRKSLESADAVLIVGAHAFTYFLHSDGPPLRAGVPVVQVDDDPARIGRGVAVTCGIVAAPRAALQALTTALARRMTTDDRARAAERGAAVARSRLEYRQRAAATAQADAERVPVSVAHLFATLAELLPADVAVVDESASSLPQVLRYLPLGRRADVFGSKTGTLGWAMGAALGVQLAWPQRRVVATIGDGSLMYAPQALWTAARYGLPVTYLVVNNASYAILKAGMLALGLPGARAGVFPGMDLVPEIDYVALARAVGVEATRVDKPAALRDALGTALTARRPTLVDVAVERGMAGSF